MGHLRIALATVVLVLLGAVACGPDSDPAARRTDRAAHAAAPGPLPPPLEGVDASALSDDEKRALFGILDAVNSPCGQPVSITRCVREGTDCAECRHAARFAVRLLADGWPANIARELLHARYARDAVTPLSLEGCAWKGGAGSRVTIVEFADFQCPHCKEAHEVLDQVFEDSAIAASTRLCYRFFPLAIPGHENARSAALAAVAAMNQGKFWQMHDLLYSRQEELTPVLYVEFARTLGLDLTRFQADLVAPATEARVQRDRAEGDSIHIEGTPAIYVNGRTYDNRGIDVSSLRSYIHEELER